MKLSTNTPRILRLAVIPLLAFIALCALVLPAGADSSGITPPSVQVGVSQTNHLGISCTTTGGAYNANYIYSAPFPYCTFAAAKNGYSFNTYEYCSTGLYGFNFYGTASHPIDTWSVYRIPVYENCPQVTNNAVQLSPNPSDVGQTSGEASPLTYALTPHSTTPEQMTQMPGYGDTLWNVKGAPSIYTSNTPLATSGTCSTVQTSTFSTYLGSILNDYSLGNTSNADTIWSIYNSYKTNYPSSPPIVANVKVGLAPSTASIATEPALMSYLGAHFSNSYSCGSVLQNAVLTTPNDPAAVHTAIGSCVIATERLGFADTTVSSWPAYPAETSGGTVIGGSRVYIDGIYANNAGVTTKTAARPNVNLNGTITSASAAGLNTFSPHADPVFSSGPTSPTTTGQGVFDAWRTLIQTWVSNRPDVTNPSLSTVEIGPAYVQSPTVETSYPSDPNQHALAGSEAAAHARCNMDTPLVINIMHPTTTTTTIPPTTTTTAGPLALSTTAHVVYATSYAALHDDATYTTPRGYVGSSVTTLIGPHAPSNGSCAGLNWGATSIVRTFAARSVTTSTTQQTPVTNVTAAGCYTYKVVLTGTHNITSAAGVASETIKMVPGTLNTTTTTTTTTTPPPTTTPPTTTPTTPTPTTTTPAGYPHFYTVAHAVIGDTTAALHDDATYTTPSGYRGSSVTKLIGPHAPVNGVCTGLNWSATSVYQTYPARVVTTSGPEQTPVTNVTEDGCYTYKVVLTGTHNATSPAGAAGEIVQVAFAPSVTTTTTPPPTTTTTIAPGTTTPMQTITPQVPVFADGGSLRVQAFKVLMTPFTTDHCNVVVINGASTQQCYPSTLTITATVSGTNGYTQCSYSSQANCDFYVISPLTSTSTDVTSPRAWNIEFFTPTKGNQRVVISFAATGIYYDTHMVTKTSVVLTPTAYRTKATCVAANDYWTGSQCDAFTTVYTTVPEYYPVYYAVNIDPNTPISTIVTGALPTS